MDEEDKWTSGKQRPEAHSHLTLLDDSTLQARERYGFWTRMWGGGNITRSWCRSHGCAALCATLNLKRTASSAFSLGD